MSHTVPQVPQLSLAVCRSTQVPLQEVALFGQPQVPLKQPSWPVHAVPQVPQFVRSVCRFTQLVPHRSGVAVGQVQAPAVQL